MSRRPLLVAGALIAVAAVVLPLLKSPGRGTPKAASSAPRSSSSPTSAAAGTGTLLRIDPAANKVVVEALEAGMDPRAVAVGEGSVWVADAREKAILRLDPATGKAQATIAMSQDPRAVAIGGVPGVWVNTLDRVWEIDPRSNQVVLTRDLEEPTGAIANGEGWVWVTGLLSGVDRIDPTDHLDRHFAGMILCSSCQGPGGGGWSGDHQRGASPSVAAGLGWVWAIGAPPPEGVSPVWRIDPATGSSKPIRVPFAPAEVAVGANGVWALGTNGAVARIDSDAKVVKIIEATGRGVTHLAAGLGAVWVLSPMLGTVIRIDPETNEVVATIDVGAEATAIAAGYGWVWVTRIKQP